MMLSKNVSLMIRYYTNKIALKKLVGIAFIRYTYIYLVNNIQVLLHGPVCSLLH